MNEAIMTNAQLAFELEAFFKEANNRHHSLYENDRTRQTSIENIRVGGKIV